MLRRRTRDLNIKSNYIPLEKFSIANQYVTFLETTNYNVTKALQERNISFGIDKEYEHPERKYLIIIVRVRKSDMIKFDTLMAEEIPGELIRLGYDDFESEFRRFTDEIADFYGDDTPDNNNKEENHG